MLASEEWSHLGALWDESTRSVLNLVWHRLKGSVLLVHKSISINFLFFLNRMARYRARFISSQETSYYRPFIKWKRLFTHRHGEAFLSPPLPPHHFLTSSFSSVIMYRLDIQTSHGIRYFPQSCLIHSNRQFPSSPPLPPLFTLPSSKF